MEMKRHLSSQLLKIILTFVMGPYKSQVYGLIEMCQLFKYIFKY